MEKIAEFKQQQFILKTNEKKTLKYTDPNYCVLYKTKKEGFIIKQHIETTNFRKFENYKDAIDAFNMFIESLLKNE